MAQIKLRRMTDAARLGVTPASGEPVWTTDTKKLYVGDGATAGGVAVDTVGGMQAHTHAIADITGLQAALNNAGSGGSAILITTPTISGASAAPAGQSVTLTASGSQYLWGGSSGIIYRWTRADGTTVDGATVNVQAGQTVSVQARDVNGNVSQKIEKTVAISVNRPPLKPSAVTDLPQTVQQSVSYPINYTSTDLDGDTVTILYRNVVGCTISGNSVTVISGATRVAYDVVAIDSRGAESDVLNVERSGENVQPPPNSTVLPAVSNYQGGVVDPDGKGVTWLTPGTYTFTPPAGVTEYSAIAVGAGGYGSPGHCLYLGNDEWSMTSGPSGGSGTVVWRNNITADSITITVGSAQSSYSYGGAGGASSLGTLGTAPGGKQDGSLSKFVGGHGGINSVSSQCGSSSNVPHVATTGTLLADAGRGGLGVCYPCPGYGNDMGKNTKGSNGAVRIIWGSGRAFPNTAQVTT